MQQRIIVKTFQGFESVLAAELFTLGATEVEVLNRAVRFNGDKALLYAANIHLRTALKVMIPLLEGKARNEQQLYDLVKQFDWGDVMRVDDTFSISQAIYSRFFPHGNYAALKIKDAIADHFREMYGMRPSVDRDAAIIQLHVHIAEDSIQISLDSSGDSLHLRGYRTETHAAPMSEVQAAGLIALSGWDPKTTLYDPMCGSGTLPIEAALIAANVAPGLIRKHYAFQRWHDYDAALYRQLILEAASKVKRQKLHVIGSDISGRHIDMAQHHAEVALPDMKLAFFKKDFQLADPPPQKGIVIMNPPYGERLQKEDMIAFYQMIGNVLKQKYAGWTAWIFTGNMEAAKFIGLKPSEKYKLKNGPLDALFLRFDIKDGKYFREKE
jgi:putative N6-adenine-specific DNA methylase